MGIISRAEKRDERLKYKNMYETELNNRKKYEKRYKEVIEENYKLQKETGIAELRKELKKVQDELAFVKEDRAKLYIQLEDLRNEKQLKLKKIVVDDLSKVNTTNNEELYKKYEKEINNGK